MVKKEWVCVSLAPPAAKRELFNVTKLIGVLLLLVGTTFIREGLFAVLQRKLSLGGLKDHVVSWPRPSTERCSFVVHKCLLNL